MYSNFKKEVNLNEEERAYPISSPEIGYYCCAQKGFYYQENEGSDTSRYSHKIGDINQAIPERMHFEIAKTYSAGSSIYIIREYYY